MAPTTSIAIESPAANQRSATKDAGFSEAPFWQSLAGKWRLLHGRMLGNGWSLEWHELPAKGCQHWGRSFHPDSLEVCINISGHATLQHEGRGLKLNPRSMAFYCTGDSSVQATRTPGNDPHVFLTLEMSLQALRHVLESVDQGLHPLITQALDCGRFPTGLGEVKQQPFARDQWLHHFLNPPVPQAALPLWMNGRIRELIATCLFDTRGSQELFCDRHKRLSLSRVEQVMEILRNQLADPPSLERLGRRVGCSPYHLSRTFSKETGQTIQQYIRKVRMEKAADLLRTGRFNVTEAALEVGYNSMSHFSQAFCHEMGVCPALYQKQTSAS